MKMLKMIGKRIKLARIETGLKQWDLANQLGVSQNTISSWESGRTEVGTLTLIKISQLFRKPLDYFYEPFEFETSSQPTRGHGRDKTSRPKKAFTGKQRAA